MYYEEPKKGNKTLLFLTLGVVVLGLIIFAIIMILISRKKPVVKPKEELACELAVTKGESAGGNAYFGDVEVSFKSKSPTNIGNFGIGLSKTYTRKEVYLINSKTTQGEVTVYGYLKDDDGNESTCSLTVAIQNPSNLQCTLGVKEGKLGLNDWYTSDIEVEFKTKGNVDTEIAEFGITGYHTEKEDIDPEENLEDIEIPYNNKDTFLITGDGHTEVYGIVKDKSNNVALCKLVVKKAAKKPECTLKVTKGTKQGNKYIDNVTVEFDKVTPGALEVTEKGIGESKNYKDKTYTVTKNGTTKVNGYVTDEAGNEATCSITIEKGTSTVNPPQPPQPPQPPAPTSTCSLTVSNGTAGANGWFKTDVVVRLASGSNNPSFGIGTSKNYNGNYETMVKKDGQTKVYGYVKNSSGKEGTCSLTVKRDTTKPICSLKVTSGTLSGSDYTTQVVIGFNQSPTDAVSGVDTYGIGTSKNYNKNNTFTVSTSGTHTINAYVKDKAGNEGTCSIKVTLSLNSLAKTAKVGDYVAYDAGSFSSTLAFPTATSAYNFKFGGYSTGNSRNTRTVKCDSQQETTTAGWRILSISGDVVTLIHGGAPECYYHPSITGQSNLGYNSEKILSGSTNGTINALYTSTPRSWSGYINSNYATSATVFTKAMYDNYLKLSGTSKTDSLIKIGVVYYLGTASSASALYGVSATTGDITGYSYRVYAVRPVVTLRANIQTNGKNASGAWTLK